MFDRSVSDKVKYLYTPTVKRFGEPQLVEELEGRQGFRSVFGYPESTALAIRKQKSMRNISHLPVYCDTLFVDFDDQPAAAGTFCAYLDMEGIAYEEFDSGNRSYHYHIPVEPVVGSWVPRAAYDFARKHADGCDLSIYRHTGLFRLMGTWHEKRPGNLKTRIKAGEGRSITLKEPEHWEAKHTADDQGVPLGIITAKRVDSGGRRCYVYTIGSVCCKRNLPEEQALQIALEWNTNNAIPPLDPEIVWQKVKEAYS